MDKFFWSLLLTSAFCLYGMKKDGVKTPKLDKIRRYSTMKRSSSDDFHKRRHEGKRRSIPSEQSWLASIPQNQLEERKSSKKTRSLEELLIKHEDLELSYNRDPDKTLTVVMAFMAEKGFLYRQLGIAHEKDSVNTQAAVLRYCVDHGITISELHKEHYNKKPADARKALRLLVLRNMNLYTLMRIFALNRSNDTKQDLPKFLYHYNHYEEVVGCVQKMQQEKKTRTKNKKKKKKKKKQFENQKTSDKGSQIYQFSGSRIELKRTKET